MKKIILLLSFVFVSCVTANTGERDLSAVNTAEGENINLAHALLHRKKIQTNVIPPTPKKRKQSPEQRQRGYHTCKRSCPDPCVEDSYKSCMRYCYNKYYSKKEGVKVTSIGDQNPFKLLDEAQNNFEQPQSDFFEQLYTEDNNHIDKAPLMLAVDYDCCVKLCIDEDGSFSQCHRVCEE